MIILATLRLAIQLKTNFNIVLEEVIVLSCIGCSGLATLSSVSSLVGIVLTLINFRVTLS